jgi:hypothetical protein
VNSLFKHGDLGESLYPVLYVSSKGEAMRIDDTEAMNDFRLVTVYNKAVAQGEEEGRVAPLFDALKSEIVRRGLDVRFKGGRPPIEKPPCDEGFC